MKQKKTNESGFSLLELLLVVGVGALLLLGGLGVYRLVTQGNTINDATRFLTTLKNETQITFQNQALYEGGTGGDMTAILIAAGAVPSANVAGTVINDPWGNAVTVTANGNQFDVGLTGVSEDACLSLGALFNGNSDADFAGVLIGTSTTPLLDTTIANLVDECDANVDMTFSFF